MNPSTSSIEYAQIWYESVLRNCRVNKTTLHIGKPGRHTLKILAATPARCFRRSLYWISAHAALLPGAAAHRAEEVH